MSRPKRPTVRSVKEPDNLDREMMFICVRHVHAYLPRTFGELARLVRGRLKDEYGDNWQTIVLNRHAAVQSMAQIFSDLHASERAMLVR